MSSARKRPNWGPRQVKSPQELEIFAEYASYSEGILMENVMVIKKPFKDNNGNLKIGAISSIGGEEERFLSDDGVVPYNDGEWNHHNYLQRNREISGEKETKVKKEVFEILHNLNVL